MAALLACGGDAARPGARATAAGEDSTRAAEAPVTVTSDTSAVAPVLPPARNAPLTPPAVTEFLGYVEAGRVPDSTRSVAVRTADGLSLLAAAIESLVQRDTLRDVDLGPSPADLRARAESMRQSRQSDDAGPAAGAFVLASDLLQALQARAQPALTDRAAEARQAAVALRTDRPLSGQGPEVQRFFERAAAALRGLVGAPAF